MAKDHNNLRGGEPALRTLAAQMKIASPESTAGIEETQICEEADVYGEMLDLKGLDLLDLGCGKALHTRILAERFGARSLLALEVDARQHQENLGGRDLPNVRFAKGGAQAIPAADTSFDGVFMFKSLHHVPISAMDEAIKEIRRVLRPGGFAYISEPVFAGDYNEILRTFHDEKAVREAAFLAIRRAVAGGVLKLRTQHFFATPVDVKDFAAFEARAINVTHSEHHLGPQQIEAVRLCFERVHDANGGRFLAPIRVDLLHRPAV